MDRGFETLKWLNVGNRYGGVILEHLVPRVKNPEIKFRIGDILWHKEFGWRGVVYGWSERCEIGEEWLKQNNALDKKDFPFYNLLCNDGKFRYGSQLTHERVEGPLQFIEDINPTDLRMAQRHLDMYFHSFSNEEGAYIPNAHLARRYPEPSWATLLEKEEGDEDWMTPG